MRPLLPALLLASVFPAAAFAQSAPDVADLAGARAAGGETQLLARGYESRFSNVVGDQRYTFWWNARTGRSEEHTSELQSLMRISYAVFCLKKKTQTQ